MSTGGAIETQRITDWLWRLSTPAVAAYAVRQGDGFNLVDTGLPGGAEGILGALATIGGPAAPLHEIVLTHGHRDHAGSTAGSRRATSCAGSDPPASSPSPVTPRAASPSTSRKPGSWSPATPSPPPTASRSSASSTPTRSGRSRAFAASPRSTSRSRASATAIRCWAKRGRGWPGP